MRALFAGVLALSALAPRPDRAFSNVAVGDPVRDRELPAAAGGKAPLLGDARASAFVFFRTDNENSAAALDELSFVERDLAGKGARFVAVVSDSDDLERAKAMMRHAGLKMPLLVDARDALYGELGVRLHPVVGVVDARKRLAAYEHYRKVGFRRIVRARIEVALGDAGPADVEKVLAPAPSGTGDALSPALRWVALGKKELARGDAVRAEASARKGLDLAPGHAPAHVLLGRALAVQGRCPEARAAFDAALRLAPADAEASEGLRGCAAR